MTPAVQRSDDAIADAEAAFARLPAGDLLLRYQQSTLSRLFAGTALLVIEKSRRIGLTWGLAAYAVLRAAARKSASGDHVFYMGYEQEMAREFIDACAMWARAFKIAAAAVDEEIFEDQDGSGETKAIKAFRIVFASGFRIVSLPSMPRAFRGKQGVVIIDEAAFHGALDQKIKAALALLMWGGQVVIVSTHDGIANPFAELIDQIRAGAQKGEVLTITFDEAIADGLYERIVLVGGARGRKVEGKAEWIANIRAFYGDNAAEELDVIPKVGSGSLIKPEDLASCEHDDAGRPELYSGGLMYVGRDVARRRDASVQLGFELVGDVLWERDVYDETGTSFAHQDAFFDQLFATRRVALAGIDQTGMGEKVVEDAQRRHGDSRVQGFLLTGPTRLDLGISLQQRFERGLIRIKPDARRRADLRAIKKASTTGGGVRLVNDETVHADYFWAAAIASRLADLPPALYDYRRVKKAGSDGGGGGGWNRPDTSGDGGRVSPRGY